MAFRSGRRVVFFGGGGGSTNGSNTASSSAGGLAASAGRLLGRTVVALAVAAVPALLVYSEHSFREAILAVREARQILRHIDADAPPPPPPASADPPPYDAPAESGPLAHLVGSLVHVSSRHVAPRLVSDVDFGLEFPAAVKVARVTEYCQWQEHFTEDSVTETDANGDEHETIVRRYYYTKGWHSYRIPSIFFDQPVAHHNPQRDPFPSSTIVAEYADFGIDGGVRIHADVLASATPLRPQRSFTKAQLTDFSSSPAATTSGAGGGGSTSDGGSPFRYVGGGYFLSRYEASAAEQLLKLAGRYLEGSLDVQLGDLFSFCAAGDVRVAFDATVVPAGRGAAAIGRLESASGDVGVYTTSRNYKIGLFAPDASTSAAEMFRRVVSRARWYLLGARALVAIWALIVATVWTSSSPAAAVADPLRRRRMVARAAGLFAAAVGGSSLVVRGPAAVPVSGAMLAAAGTAAVALADPRADTAVALFAARVAASLRRGAPAAAAAAASASAAKKNS
ncbi:hypothetical protein HK405_013289 [Cladochytrium tenue]|nr:hypothetical protein HK405_013289 [Cladochytrium tenue]